MASAACSRRPTFSAFPWNPHRWMSLPLRVRQGCSGSHQNQAAELASHHYPQPAPPYACQPGVTTLSHSGSCSVKPRPPAGDCGPFPSVSAAAQCYQTPGRQPQQATLNCLQPTYAAATPPAQRLEQSCPLMRAPSTGPVARQQTSPPPLRHSPSPQEAIGPATHLSQKVTFLPFSCDGSV